MTLGQKPTTPCIDYGGEWKRAPNCRKIWEKIHGPIPEGLNLCHSCDSPRCINTDYFFLDTHSGNMLDCSIKKRNKGRTGMKASAETRKAMSIAFSGEKKS